MAPDFPCTLCEPPTQVKNAPTLSSKPSSMDDFKLPSKQASVSSPVSALPLSSYNLHLTCALLETLPVR